MTEKELPKMYSWAMTEQEFKWQQLAHNRQVATLFGNIGMLVLFTTEVQLLIAEIGEENMPAFITGMNEKMAKLKPGLVILKMPAAPSNDPSRSNL